MTLQARNKIIEKIKDPKIKNVAIVMHNNPDGDCIGSSVALEEVLKSYNKKVDIIMHNKVSKVFAPIIGKNRVDKFFIPYEDKIYDLTFMIDVSDFNRTYHDIRRISKQIVIIDHHIVSKQPKVNVYLNEHDASTGITIYKFIKFISPISSKIATALYLTIRSDTGNFKNSNTNSKVHEIAAELLLLGADIHCINAIYDDKSLNYLSLLSTVLPDIKIDKQYKIAYLIISKSSILNAKSNMKEAGMVIDLIKNIEDIDICFLLIENIDHVIIKGRSKYTNIISIFEEIGGGGHENSTGCLVYSDDVYRTKERLLQITKDYIDSKP